MHDQEQEIEKLRAEVAELQEKLDGYEIKVSESGSLAEASAKISGLFEAAQATVSTYVENMKSVTPAPRRSSPAWRSRLSR